MNTNNHMNLNHVDVDSICRFTACIADTILKPLFELALNRDLYGYAEVLEIVSEWAKEFYVQYYEKLKDWDAFEESKENIYNAISWDDFATNWANQRFQKFKSQLGSPRIAKKWFANTKMPKIIIVHKGQIVSSVYSTIPIVYAVIDFNEKGEFTIRTSESDSVANELYSLFDSGEKVDASIIKQLKQLRF